MADLMPLDDVRVIDLTQHAAGPFCTRLLADYGAEVIKVERPGGDPARAMPPFFQDEPGLERSGLFLFLNTNKQSVVLDLETAEGRARLLDLVAGAEVLVENYRPGTLDALGLGYEALRAVNPRLVMTSITNFGQTGPYRDFEATDITLYAMGGPMAGSGDPDHEPLKTAGRVTSYHAGYVGALATAAALRGVEQRGSGEHVDVSIYETAIHSIDLRLSRLLGYQYSGRIAGRPPRGFTVASGTLPCKDGFFMMGGSPDRLPRVIRMIGREDLLEQEEWATLGARARPERIEEFQAYLLPWMAEHTRSEIRAACQEFGVPAAPINSVADLLADENFVHRRFFQTIDHPETGPLTYPGYHFTLHRPDTPMPQRRRAPSLGEHTDAVLGSLATRPRVAASPAAGPAPSEGRLPLEGVRILDFTVVFAGPYSTMHLAEWGAEVIRVESLQHFAPNTRGTVARPPPELVAAQSLLSAGYPDDEPGPRPWNRFAAFNHHSRNKLSMTVDLTRPEGQEVLHRLVEVSDGLMENNLPPNIEKHGVSWERLGAVNPKLVMVRIPAFGIDGPYRGYRTFGHHMEALSGHPAIRSYPGESYEYAPLGVPSDAASGVGSAFAFLMGLRYRERTGEGLLVELATAENFVPLIGEYVMDYTMNGRLWEKMGNTHAWLAPHNVYRCRGLDRWVAIAVRDEDEWRSLCEAMRRDDLAADPRFADMAARHAHRDELDAIIETWTVERDARWVMHRLQGAGVPAGAVMTEADAYEDPHHQARDFFQEVVHPEAGTHRLVGRAWKASESPAVPARHAPLLGEDNAYVYRELLGFSASEYRRFEELGHIGTEYDPSIR
jgi:crotonobetainyl-CoA:carnitine CoA-transferase CaiB-like acyl-CoA transferase